MDTGLQGFRKALEFTARRYKIWHSFGHMSTVIYKKMLTPNPNIRISFAVAEIDKFVDDVLAQDLEAIAVAEVFDCFQHNAEPVNPSISIRTTAIYLDQLRLQSPAFIFVDPLSSLISGLFVYSV